MATNLIDIVDPHIVVNGKVIASASLSPDALKQYVVHHPTALKSGWTVNGTGQIIQAAPVPAYGSGLPGKPNASATSAAAMVHNNTAAAAPAATPAGVAGPGPMPATPPQPNYAWQLVNGHWVQVLQPIDPRDGQYQSDVSQATYTHDTGVAQQEAARAKLPSLYNQGAAGIRTAYDQNRYASNAELAHRGIIHSGEYQHRAVDRLTTQANQQADLERQYGTGAQADIAARLNEINNQYSLSQQQALQAAKDRYAQQYPASTYILSNTQ